jgi:hypothetical protein
MQPKIEQMVQEVVHPHLQPSLNKQCILEETISQLQDDNTKFNSHAIGNIMIYKL